MAAILGAAVPDYRGRFLRHVGGNSAALGVAQGDAIRNVTAYLGSDFSHGMDGDQWAYGAGWHDPSKYAGYKNGSAPGGVQHQSHLYFDAGKVVPTAAENRPVNMAVKWLIFAGD